MISKLLFLLGTERLSPLPFLLLLAGVLFVSFPARTLNRSSAVAVVMLALAVFGCLAASFYQFIVDDVFISLRFARNLANGHGLVFNTDGSGRVEGYTNFLWVLMEAPLFLLSIPDSLILHAIRIAGIIFGAGVILMTSMLARQITGDIRCAALSALFLAVVPEFSFWSVGGLETSMYMFWMMSGLYMYIHEKRKGSMHITSMLLFVLMALTRPEGLFFTAALLFTDILVAALGRNDHGINRKAAFRNIAIAAGVFAALYSTYFFWRYSYYGLPLPNTFYAKKVSSAGYIVHRIRQVSDFFVPLFPFFAFGILGYLHFASKMIRERFLLASMLVVLVGFAFAARNEWMPGFRYEVPFIPLLMIFFSAGISNLFFRNEFIPVKEWKGSVARFSVIALLGMFLLFGSRELQKTGNLFTSKLERAHVPLGKWLKKHAPENSKYASWDMGAVPYFSSIPHVVDINSEGLLNTHTTFKGYDIEKFLEQDPCFLVLPPDTDYVRPAEIRNFYSHEKLRSGYEYLFSFAFDRDYLLNVYKNKRVNLSDAAITEGKHLAEQSRLQALNQK